MAWLIVQAISSIIMIVVGIGMVSSGNDSPQTIILIISGCIWLITEIYQMATFKKRKEANARIQAEAQQFTQNPNMMQAQYPQQPPTQGGYPQAGQMAGQNPQQAMPFQNQQQAIPFQNQTQQQNVQNPPVSTETPPQAVAAWLAVPKNIKLTPVGDARSHKYRATLNVQFVGESDAKGDIYFSTWQDKNLLYVEDDLGVKSLPFLFDVIEDGSGDATLYIGYDTFGNTVILLSAGLNFSDMIGGIKKLG